jgi:hypothetical protein
MGFWCSYLIGEDTFYHVYGAAYPHLLRCAKVTIIRRMIWIEVPRFQVCGCSECSWVFKPSWPPAGNSLDEMKEIFAGLRDREFAIHVCAEHPMAKRTIG